MKIDMILYDGQYDLDEKTMALAIDRELFEKANFWPNAYNPINISFYDEEFADKVFQYTYFGYDDFDFHFTFNKVVTE